MCTGRQVQVLVLVIARGRAAAAAAKTQHNPATVVNRIGAWCCAGLGRASSGVGGDGVAVVWLHRSGELPRQHCATASGVGHSC